MAQPTDPKHQDPVEDLVPEDDAVIGRALRISLLAVGLLALLGGGVFWLWRLRGADETPERQIEATAPRQVSAQPQPPAVSFQDVTLEAGIDFVHHNGAYGERLLPETMGGGGAFFDFDNDGDQDLLLVNSDHWPHRPAPDPRPTMALYENDGSGSFQDISAATGFAVSFYGTGVAVGDYDNDGFVDVFLCAVGRNHLFHNRPGPSGKRVFQDVTATARLGGDPREWSTSAAFFDYDNDGDLDLFVANYVRWSKDIDLKLDYRLTGIGRAYGPPVNYQGTFPYLYRNDGDATFTDVSAEAGVQVLNPSTGAPMAKSLGLAPVDVDRDGYLDLLVANDTVGNFFFHNQGDGTFVEKGELFGLAYGRDGNATGAMGVDSGHYRNDGELGFLIGNFANEMTSLYVSQGDPTLYADEAIIEGVGAASRLMLTFGLFLFDYDLDGRLDLLQANGHLEEEINTVDPSQHYLQPAQLFWNAGPEHRQTFLPVPVESTGDLATPLAGRGASYADIDGDGDLDVLLLQTGGRPLLLRNEEALGHHWLRVKLQGNGTTSNRDAIGAWVFLSAGGVEQTRQVMPTRSYQCQVELPVTFGLGLATLADVERLTVTWPDGTTTEVGLQGLDRTVVVVEDP